MISIVLFQRSSGYELVAFGDANYARQATDRKSVSGGVIACAGDLRVLVLEHAEMCHAFDHRDRRGDIVCTTAEVISIPGITFQRGSGFELAAFASANYAR
ncbi:MAG: hypothetical protein ABJJ43_00150 [Ekhidna sp.]